LKVLAAPNPPGGIIPTKLTSVLERAHHKLQMRTTLAIDDDLLDQVRAYAANRSLSVGKAASELIRRGISRPLATNMVDGLHLPVLPDDSPLVTSERVRELEDE
jgi:hypothetical protein